MEDASAGIVDTLATAVLKVRDLTDLAGSGVVGFHGLSLRSTVGQFKSSAGSLKILEEN